MAGTTAVVGADDTGANSSAGAAYIYEKGASGWPTTPTVTLTDPAATAGDEFGFSVAVAVTGTTVIVGAPLTSSSEGAAYIYVKGASGWPTTPTVTLTDPAATADDNFGLLGGGVENFGDDRRHRCPRHEPRMPGRHTFT